MTLKEFFLLNRNRVINAYWHKQERYLLFGLTSELDTNSQPGIKLERIQIDKIGKKRVLSELDRMGFHESTMFPEIEKAALYIRDKINTGG